MQILRKHLESYLAFAEQAKYSSARAALDAALEQADREISAIGNESDKQVCKNLVTTYMNRSLSKVRIVLDMLPTLNSASLQKKIEPALFWSYVLDQFTQRSLVVDKSLNDAAQQRCEQFRKFANDECKKDYLLPVLARFLGWEPLRTYRRFFAVDDCIKSKIVH